MAITLVNAKIYVARIIGGGAESQEPLDMAGEAIVRGYQDWQNRKYWRFLLRDNSLPTLVSGLTATLGSPTVNAVTAGTLDFVNAGQVVTVSSGTGTLVAGTTVLTVTRGADGVVTSLTLSNNFGGSTATATETLSFAPYISLVPGTNDYALPNDFYAPFSALLLTNKRTLTYRDQRYWDRVIVDQSVRGTPSDYGLYNQYSELTQNFGTKRLRFDRLPDVADTLLLRYYRSFNVTSANIDIPDDFLYPFLDYCRSLLLITKRAQDDPQGYMKDAEDATAASDKQDEQPTDDDDYDRGLKSQYEMGDYNRPLWGNGAFDPYRY